MKGNYILKYEDYTFVFDVDGTICPVKKPDEKYEDLTPYPEIVEKIQDMKKEGARIIICSSRNMRTYENNIGLINANTAPVMIDWLKKWEIPFDEIIFGKPWAGKKGFYVDDRTVRPREFAELTTDQMDELCKRDRMGE